MDVNRDRAGRKTKTVERKRPGKIAGIPAEIDHRRIEASRRFESLVRAFDIAVKTQLVQLFGGRIQPLIAVGMWPAFVDVVTSEQSRALTGERGSDQTLAVVECRSVEPRNLDDQLLLETRRPLAAKKR